MNFERNLRAIASTYVVTNLHEAIILADALAAAAVPTPRPKANLSDPDALVKFARANKEVMAFIPDRKIQAIKALRSAAALVPGSHHVGLLEAKNAIDTIQPAGTWTSSR